MKIQKVIDICKKSGELYLTHAEGVQWVGNGTVLYPLVEFPEVSIDDICSIYEITQEQRDKIIMNDKDASEYTGVNFKNAGPDEEAAETMQIGITAGGNALVLLKHSGGISFVKRKYFAPFKEEIQMWRRVGSGGEYFIATSGMFTMGILFPERDSRAQISSEIKEIAEMI